MDYDGLFSDAYSSGNPSSYISNNYKKYGFTNVSRADQKTMRIG